MSPSLKYFASISRGDPQQAAEYMARRLGMLVVAADLTPISRQQFTDLVRLFNGLVSTDKYDAKDALLSCIHGTLKEVDQEQEELGPSLTGGSTSAANRAQMAWAPQSERMRLRELFSAIDQLDAVACLALLTRIEEVYSMSDVGKDLLPVCEKIYQKMQDREPPRL
jgi:hypothetical protein